MSLHTAIIAAALALVLTPVMIRIAPYIGAIAKSGERHVHENPIPTAAGLAIVIAVWVPTLIANWPISGPLLGMFIGTLVLPVCSGTCQSCFPTGVFVVGFQLISTLGDQNLEGDETSNQAQLKTRIE